MDHIKIDNIIKEFHLTFDKTLWENLLYKLSQDGDLDGIKYLISQIPDIDKEIVKAIEYAIKNNNMFVFKYLLNNYQFYGYILIKLAILCCKYTNFEMFEYISNKYEQPMSHVVYYNAIDKSNSKIILKYMIEHIKIYRDFFFRVCRYGELDMLKYVENVVDTKIDYELAFYHACLGGNIDNIKYLEKHICHDLIVGKKEIEINDTRYLISDEISKKCYDWGFYFACISGVLSVVKYLENHVDGIHFCWFFYDLCRSGNLHIIKYLINIFGKDIFSKNVVSKSIDCMSLIQNSSEYKCLDIINFFIKEYNVSNFIIEIFFRNCCRDNKINMAIYLVNKYNFPNYYKLLVNICEYDYIDNFKYCINFCKNFGEKIYELFLHACEYNAIKIVKYMYNEYKDILSEQCDIEYINKLLGRRNICVIKFLLDNNQQLYDQIDYFQLLRHLCSQEYHTALLFFINKAIDDNKMTEYDIVKLVCCENNCKSIQFVLDKFPDVDIHYNDDEIFLNVCVNKYYLPYDNSPEIAKFLISRFPEIDIHCHNGACLNTRNPELLEWLESGCYLPGKNIKCAI